MIDNKNCSYICDDREWYLRFFKNIDGSNNAKFLELYIKALRRYFFKRVFRVFQFRIFLVKLMKIINNYKVKYQKKI